MTEAKKILYVQTSGTNTPERLYSPLILAQTAKAMGLEATVYFLGLGLKNLVKEEAEKVKVGEFPTLLEVLKQTASQGVAIMACQQSMQLFGGEIKAEDLLEEAVIAGAATLNDLALEADAVLSF
ncbi:MAG: DsrE family protein [Bacillota bacterium]|nr:DsrE family protein [Bacillota bacterium]MDW7729625.1 DsrE family protein [Bacillota bacterium]